MHLLLVALRFVLAAMIVAISVLAYTPPVSRDALTQHLVIPKLYLEKQAIYNIPELPSSYNPMNLDLLYAIPLYLGNDILAKFIHFAFALLTIWLVWGYLSRRIGKAYAYLGAVFFLSTPIIIKLSITAYVDLGLIFFSTAALLTLFQWAVHRFKPRYLLLSAIYCGLAMGTKYNGLIVFFLLTLVVPWLYEKTLGKDSATAFISVRHLVTYVVIALLLFSPWMVRDAIWTGNPIYPLFDSFFNTGQVHTPVLGHFAVRKMVFGESWWEILLLPLRLFFQGQDGNPQFFDGRLNAALLILPCFAFLRVRSEAKIFRTEKSILLVFSILFLLFAFLQTDLRARYVGPILVPLVILSLCGLRNLLAAGASHLPDRYQGTVSAVILPALLVAMLLPNGIYLFGQFSKVQPIAYLSGNLNRDAYIQRFWPEYAADRFINSHLQHNARILAFFLGHRAYYIDREINFDTTLLKGAIQQPVPLTKVLETLQQKKITHLLIRLDLFETWAAKNFDSRGMQKLRHFLNQDTKQLFYRDGFAVLALRDATANQPAMRQAMPEQKPDAPPRAPRNFASPRETSP